MVIILQFRLLSFFLVTNIWVLFSFCSIEYIFYLLGNGICGTDHITLQLNAFVYDCTAHVAGAQAHGICAERS